MTNENKRISIKETASFTEIDILKNGTKIGYAEVSGEELVQLKIYEPFQNQGYGSSALGQILSAYNIKKINVMAENQKAFHLYEKYGFYINDLNMFEMRNDYFRQRNGKTVLPYAERIAESDIRNKTRT